MEDASAPAESRALGVIAGLAVLAILWVVLPVGIGVLLGTLLAFTVHKTFRQLVRRTHRPWVAAALLTSSTTLVVTGALALIAYLLVLQGVNVVGAVPQSLAKGGSAEAFVERAMAPLAILGLHPADVADRIRDAVGSLAALLAGWAARLVGAVVDAILAILFMAITMYFVLVHWRELALHAERLMPIRPRHTRLLLRSMQSLGRQVVLGNFGTAVVQGALAGAGYWVAGLPQPAFFGAMSALFSLVPIVGTPIVWVPAGLVLAFGGHLAAGIFVLVWGAVVVVGFCDYVLRPRMLGGGEAMSSWLTLVGIFGGIKLFGFVGFLLGPLLCGVAVAALRLYERTRSRAEVARAVQPAARSNDPVTGRMQPAARSSDPASG